MIKVKEFKEVKGKRLVARFEVQAKCDEFRCTWQSEVRSIKATAERDLAIHMREHADEGRLF
jgi:hypothetical protein